MMLGGGEKGGCKGIEIGIGIGIVVYAIMLTITDGWMDGTWSNYMAFYYTFMIL